MTTNLVGVDLGGTKVTAGRVVGTDIVQKETTLISAHGDEQTVLEEVTTTIEKVVTPKTTAIGLGVPSVVDIEKGIVYDVQNIPSWKEVHLKRILESHFSLPVKIDNDANCFTMGEYTSRAQEGLSSLVGLILGTGAAAGIIVNGELYHGSNCGAGEFGMLPYLDSIYEHYCSGQFFEKQYGEKGQIIFAAASKGDSSALKVFDVYGKHLGQLIMAILYSVDPQIIVLGGSVSRSYPLFKDAMNESMQAFAYLQSLDNLQIQVSNQPDIAIWGAASLHYPNTQQ